MNYEDFSTLSLQVIKYYFVKDGAEAINFVLIQAPKCSSVTRIS